MRRGHILVQLNNYTDVETEAETLQGKAEVTLCHNLLGTAPLEVFSPSTLRNVPVRTFNYLVYMVTGLPGSHGHCLVDTVPSEQPCKDTHSPFF